MEKYWERKVYGKQVSNMLKLFNSSYIQSNIIKTIYIYIYNHDVYWKFFNREKFSIYLKL
jgi:hypothetical protein